MGKGSTTTQNQAVLLQAGASGSCRNLPGATTCWTLGNGPVGSLRLSNDLRCREPYPQLSTF